MAGQKVLSVAYRTDQDRGQGGILDTDISFMGSLKITPWRYRLLAGRESFAFRLRLSSCAIVGRELWRDRQESARWIRQSRRCSTACAHCA